MRALPAFLLPLVLAGCGGLSTPRYTATQREILTQAQVEVAAREPWAGSAAISVTQEPDEFLRRTWIIRAAAVDRNPGPHYSGTHYVPGTLRELRFTRAGCLIRYANRTNPCLAGASPGMTAK